MVGRDPLPVRAKVFESVRVVGGNFIANWHSWRCLNGFTPQLVTCLDHELTGETRAITERLYDEKRDERYVIPELNKREYYNVISSLARANSLHINPTKPDKSQLFFMAEYGFQEGDFAEEDDPDVVLRRYKIELEKIRNDLAAWFLDNGFNLPDSNKEEAGQQERTQEIGLNDAERKYILKELGVKPRPVPQSISDASRSALLSGQISVRFLSNAKKSWSLIHREEDAVGTFFYRLGDDVLLFLKGILERRPDFPRKDDGVEYVFGIPVAQIVDCVADEIKMAKAGPVVRDRWKLILDKLTNLSVKEIRETTKAKQKEAMRSHLSRSTNGSGLKTTLLEKCKKVCGARRIPKGKTLNRDTKYAIAKSIKLGKLPTLGRFKSGNRAYHRISSMLSQLGYSRKLAAKYRKT